MKGPALVAVEAAAEIFAPLFAAAVSARVRVGWLALEGASTNTPGDVRAAAFDAGAAKVVEVAAGRVTVHKRLAGKAVLRDLLREHFLGFAVVLVAGGDSWPRLAADGDLFVLRDSATSSRSYSAAALLAELARPGRRA